MNIFQLQLPLYAFICSFFTSITFDNNLVFHSFSLECNIIKALCQKTSEVREEENIIFGELEIQHNKAHIKKMPS